MDRFDDSRDKRTGIERSYGKSLDLSSYEGDDIKPATAKNVQELIDEEMRLENFFKTDSMEATDNGKLSETSTLLTMAQREEIFETKCMIRNKYMRALQDNFSKYRHSLLKLKEERDEYGDQMYSKGVSHGISEGEKRKENEMKPELDDAIDKSRKTHRHLVIMSILEAITAGLLFISIL